MAIFSKGSSTPLNPSASSARLRGAQALQTQARMQAGGGVASNARQRGALALQPGANDPSAPVIPPAWNEGAAPAPTGRAQAQSIDSTLAGQQAPRAATAPTPSAGGALNADASLQNATHPAPNAANPFDLATIRAQQQEALAAAGRGFDHQAAKASADANARAGLGGFGLSGAANALVADTSLQSADARAKGIAALQAQQRGELSQAVLDNINIQDAADSGVTGLDKIIPGLKTNTANAPGGLNDTKGEIGANAGIDITTVGGGIDNGNAPVGTMQQPYNLAASDYDRVVGAVGALKEYPYKPIGTSTTYHLYQDGSGKFYYFGPNGVPGHTEAFQ